MMLRNTKAMTYKRNEQNRNSEATIEVGGKAPTKQALSSQKRYKKWQHMKVTSARDKIEFVELSKLTIKKKL